VTTSAGTGTAVAALVDALREQIRLGDRVPGQRLVESDLTAEFGVSRGPLREALSRLASEGLVELEPFRGATVRRLSVEHVRQLYQVREPLEATAAALAAERIHLGDHRARLQAVLEANNRHLSSGDRRAYLDVNRDFHSLVVALSGNDVLARLVDQLRTPLQYLQFRHLADDRAYARSAAQHRTIAEAILRGDRAAAQRAMRHHVRSSAEAVLAAEVERTPRVGRL
jgi:DNA-binding GntR family transcriptional regulator